MSQKPVIYIIRRVTDRYPLRYLIACLLVDPNPGNPELPVMMLQNRIPGGWNRETGMDIEI